MMRILFIAGLVTALALPAGISAQTQRAGESPYTFNHGEITAYGDYFRFNPTGGSNPVNFVGLGGRVGFNVHPNLAMEAEMSYDFERNYSAVSGTAGSFGGASTTVVSKIRPVTGLFGPKFQFGRSSAFRAFITAKAGFLEMSSSGMSPSTTSFGNAFNQFGGSGTYFAAYPGGGFEVFLGPLGIRAEAGDEIIVNNGAFNNLRVAVGPSFRF
ncbi:MAG TPA: hypothetical protein VG267_02240 [Terracidiphilus sp.]|jgi:hypothetical protein|nr:hypothetical protein [Terracidiphilus sp.]